MENLHAMLFKQSIEQREKCQVIIFINTQHHYSLKTNLKKKTYSLCCLENQINRERSVRSSFFKHTVSLFSQNKSLFKKLTGYDVQTIKSTERGVSGHHFYKHTASLFTQNKSLNKKSLLSMFFRESCPQRE